MTFFLVSAVPSLLLLAGVGEPSGALAPKGDVWMDTVARSQWHFRGEMGRRIAANVENWLLRAPGANPGLLEMFYRRERHLPYDEPVPWAGEFAGKYLISAVQACSMSDDARLKPFVASFVAKLVASQAEDGYLGPWRKDERLLGHWDLWGHYHCMLGLLLWHDLTGDEQAYACVRRAADCICDVYAEGRRRPIDAGTPQINLSVLHIMAVLYGRTGDPRYLTLIQRIEEDMEKDGDWLRKGAAGVLYCELPGGGTRWESLHVVQGLAELHRLTGEARYKDAVVSLWESIRDFDRHPSGAFSTQECAFGTIYATGSIETCCSVAWLALTIDVLRLTGDAKVADELELTTWNQVLGAQHPSGSWCTYDNPINGVRAPSYQQIRFQYRPGTPELNCCSVNAPRGFGMLRDWAVMADDAGLFVNFYGPGEVHLRRPDGRKVGIVQDTAYPVEGTVRLTLSLDEESAFALRLRIPAWSKTTTLAVNGAPAGETPRPGTYFVLERTWTDGDRIEVTFDMTPRCWVGQGPDRGGTAAVHAGPLLLAFDAYFNEMETADLARVDMADLNLERVALDREASPGYFAPMGLWKARTTDGGKVLLCDFGSAGAHGTDFAAWLPAANVAPPTVSLKAPGEDAVGAPGAVMFRWEVATTADCTYELLVAKDPAFQELVAHKTGLKTGLFVLEDVLTEDGVYHWKVRSVNDFGVSDNRGGPRTLHVDESALAFFVMREDQLMVASPLNGDGTPSFGSVSLQTGLAPAADRFGTEDGAVAFTGEDSKLRYRVPFFPERDYSFLAWVRPEGLPAKGGIQQIFSGWRRSMDDPLRMTIDGDQVFARLEAKSAYGTQGARLKNGDWAHVAAVKQGGTLTLYVNGTEAASAQVPEVVCSGCEEIGIGFNPLYPGGEHFVGMMDDFAFYARALRADEVSEAYELGMSP